jgi:YfiH family protein
VELLTSSLLRSPHGFPTREGGVSTGAFASLNSSLSVGDRLADVEQNLARLAAAAGVEAGRLLTVTQVHGVKVVRGVPGATVEADAQWTQEPHMSVGVRTADCVPLLIEDVVTGRVAAAHAGWRGVIDGVASRTVEALVDAGSALADLRVAVGPCIQRCCFEVDGDLPARFEGKFGSGVVALVQGKARRHLDLPAALLVELARAGVGPSQVDVLRACTNCEARFFSHRRERGVTGRHLSFITCVRAAAL